eukprot:scaffold33565_cov22-Tisochrysis_lutea.AAC.1
MGSSIRLWRRSRCVMSHGLGAIDRWGRASDRGGAHTEMAPCSLQHWPLVARHLIFSIAVSHKSI